MIPDVNNSNVSRQEFIDLLCRITKTDEQTTMTTNGDNHNANEPDVIISDDTPTVEEGEIITLDDGDEDDDDVLITNKKDVEDGEITESQGSDVCMKFSIFEIEHGSNRI